MTFGKKAFVKIMNFVEETGYLSVYIILKIQTCSNLENSVNTQICLNLENSVNSKLLNGVSTQI